MKTIKHDNKVVTLNEKGELHSFNDKPAVEYNDGCKFWHKKGKLHRLDGPACEFGNGYKSYYIENVKYFKEEFENKVNKYNTVKHDDRIETLNDKGELHSFDGKPAVDWSNGDKFWYKNGKFHRVGGPAVEWNDGVKEWFKEGKFRGMDGPAFDWSTGYNYFIKGIKCTKEEFENKVYEANMKTAKYDGEIKTLNEGDAESRIEIKPITWYDTN